MQVLRLREYAGQEAPERFIRLLRRVRTSNVPELQIEGEEPMSDFKHPIDSVEWVEVDKLQANDYNPNHVYEAEMKLLEYSILTNGWIQPILVNRDFVIIDGFHRATLGKVSNKMREKFGTKVPVVILDLTEPERMLLSIRINRAKGSHIAFKMSKVIKELVQEHNYSLEMVGKGIGANKDEVELLLMRDVFQSLNIPEHKYSQAWVPK